MNKTKLSIAAVLLVAASSQATTITVADSSGALSTPLHTDASTGDALLPNGGALIRIGYFRGFTTAGNNSLLIAELSNPLRPVVYNAIQRDFVPLGEGLDPDLGPVPAAGSEPRLANRTINGVPNQPGRLIGGVAGVTPNTDPEASVGVPITGVPAGTRIFILAYNTADVNSATQLGIYTGTTWTMPSSPTAALQLNTTAVDAANEVIRGGFSPTALNLAAFIPEPSTGLMAVFAALGLMARRRR
jgi:hypothetical protein